MTPEQMVFIRQHGITHCPPGPTFDVFWGSLQRPGRVFEPSERELFNRMRAGRTVRVIGGPFRADLNDPDMGRPRDRRWKPGRRRGRKPRPLASAPSA